MIWYSNKNKQYSFKKTAPFASLKKKNHFHPYSLNQTFLICSQMTYMPSRRSKVCGKLNFTHMKLDRSHRVLTNFLWQRTFTLAEISLESRWLNVQSRNFNWMNCILTHLWTLFTHYLRLFLLFRLFLYSCVKKIGALQSWTWKCNHIIGIGRVC